MPSPSHRPALTPLFDIYPLGQAVSELVVASLEGTGVKPSDYALLSAIAAVGEISPTALTRQMGSPATTMSDWVAALVRAGLVERERNAADGRSYVIRLTAKGETATSRARDAFGEGYLAFVDAYGDDIDELRAVLADMTSAAREATDALRSRRDVAG